MINYINQPWFPGLGRTGFGRDQIYTQWDGWKTIENHAMFSTYQLVIQWWKKYPVNIDGWHPITGWWFQPLWKTLVKWDDYSQYTEKIKHVPNHKPVSTDINWWFGFPSSTPDALMERLISSSSSWPDSGAVKALTDAWVLQDWNGLAMQNHELYMYWIRELLVGIGMD